MNPSYYASRGVAQLGAPPAITVDRDPTAYDTKYPIGQIWINTTSGDIWYLSQVTGTASWVTLSPGNTTTLTGNDLTPVAPSGNNINVVGDTVQGVSSSGSGNTLTFTVADATTASKGVAEFDPTNFDVVAGVVSLTGTGAAETITGDTGGALSPTANNFNILGAAAQGVSTSGAASTLTISVQNATTAVKGVASFDSGDFSVAAGVVSLNATGAVSTLTGDSGGALSPTAGNINVVGAASQGVSSSGAGSTLTFTVADATTASKGVAEFDAGDFSVTGGVVTLNGSGATSTLTGDSGGAISPTAGNFNVVGTAAQGITSSGAGSTLTFTVADATTASKGVAQFDSGDFSVAAGVVTLNGGGAVSTITGDSGGPISPSSGNFNIVGTSAQGITSSGSGSTLTFTVQDASTSVKGVASFNSSDFTVSSGAVSALNTGGMRWSEVVGTSQAMAVGNAYILNNAGLVTATLPASATVGQMVQVVGKGSGGWAIAQNSGQTIHFGSSSTTTGVGGSLASTNQYDAIQLVCTVTDTDWTCTGVAQGNLTVV